jgi:hypothetical protein
MTARAAAPLLCVLFATAPVRAADGVLIVQRMTTGGTTATTEVQIEPNRLRAEVADPTGARQTVIFDGGKQVMMLVSAQRKTYTEITKADVDRMVAMLAQVQAQMANMPPEMRGQMDSMMRGRGLGPSVKTEYRRGGTDKVASWTCDRYDGYQDGKKITELCTVPPGVLGLREADLGVTRQMANFFRALMPQAADQMIGLGRVEEQGFSGVPVRTVLLGAGQPIAMEISEVRRETFADALFTVPAGFQRQELMNLGR